MSSFYLKILASNKVFFSGKADILVVPGLDGEIAIMAHHQNMGDCHNNRRCPLQAGGQ